MKTLEQVLADARGELPVLRRHGLGEIADAVEHLCADVAEAAEGFLTWIPESDAVIRAGHRREWFRARFAAWERQGLARWNPHRKRERQYRMLIIPASENLDAVRADARREAEREIERQRQGRAS